MRTTVTLDPDTESLVRRLMAERGISFKQAVNDAIRAGAGERRTDTVTSRVWRMGEPALDIAHALRIASDLEDQELARRMRSGQ